MRGLGLFFGASKRNDNFKLTDPHPVECRPGSELTTGDPGKDGYTLLSRADPSQQGSPPNVEGTLGGTYRGPDQSFEQ